MRTPFLDSQTGVAQVACSLWVSKALRRTPTTPCQIYSYPPERWRKKPRVTSAERTEDSSQDGVPPGEQAAEVGRDKGLYHSNIAWQ